MHENPPKKSRNHSVTSYKINSTIQNFRQGDFIFEWLHQRIFSSDVKVRATIHLAITCSRSENLSPCLSDLTFVLRTYLFVSSSLVLDLILHGFLFFFLQIYFVTISLQITPVNSILQVVFCLKCPMKSVFLTGCFSLLRFSTHYLTLYCLYSPAVVSHIH